MKYANKCNYKLSKIYLVSYLTLGGLRYEHVRAKSIEKVKRYAQIEAGKLDAVVADIKMGKLKPNEITELT